MLSPADRAVRSRGPFLRSCRKVPQLSARNDQEPAGTWSKSAARWTVSSRDHTGGRTKRVSRSGCVCLINDLHSVGESHRSRRDEGETSCGAKWRTILGFSNNLGGKGAANHVAHKDQSSGDCCACRRHCDHGTGPARDSDFRRIAAARAGFWRPESDHEDRIAGPTHNRKVDRGNTR